MTQPSSPRALPPCVHGRPLSICAVCAPVADTAYRAEGRIYRRYAYVRVSVRLNDVEVCGGLELAEGERCDMLYGALELEMQNELLPYAAADDAHIASVFERAVRARWPGRSYFCEVSRDDDRYVQVFQPSAGDWLAGT